MAEVRPLFRPPAVRMPCSETDASHYVMRCPSSRSLGASGRPRHRPAPVTDATQESEPLSLDHEPQHHLPEAVEAGLPCLRVSQSPTVSA